MKELTDLFKRTFRIKPETVTALPSSGSNRKYYRIIVGGRSAIGAVGTDPGENRAFFEMTAHFRRNGLKVPEIYAISSDEMRYLQEDLGDTTLFDAVAEGRKRGEYDEEEKELLRRAIRLLPAVQFGGASGFDFNFCHPIKDFDAMSVSFDLNYFKYCFLKTSGIPFDEVRLEEDFTALTTRLLRNCSDHFMYRDFQSRNIMLIDDEMYLIDYQGGRRGPIYYDPASFIWQARAGYSEAFKEELLDCYLEALSHFTVIRKKRFLSEYRHFVLFRTLQVLGAYGFRGNFEKKPHFLQSIPYAIRNLELLLREPFSEYPYLNMLLVRLVGRYSRPESEKDGRLHVRIYSFSYKNGIPEDTAGNGGGYVFDCRGVPNPGRLAEYRNLTGTDPEVISYLEQYDSCRDFAERTAALAEAHIQNYLERGFTDLMFSFGCTGGQHRSVYFAQKLYDRLKERNDIETTLLHRER